MVALDVQMEVIYFNAKSNPSDDPTRGVELRKAEIPLPEWWAQLAEGCFDAFDAWLEEFNLEDMAVGGLPPLDELRGLAKESFTTGNLPTDSNPERKVTDTRPEEDRSERGEELQRLQKSTGDEQKLQVIEDEMQRLQDTEDAEQRLQITKDEMQRLHDTEDEEQRLQITEDEMQRLQIREDEEDRKLQEKEKAETEIQGMPKEDETQETKTEDKRRKKDKENEEKKDRKRKTGVRRGWKLSPEAKAALAQFGKDKFVLPEGAAFPPEEAGFLDLFSGERGVAKEAARLGVWSLCFDIEHGADEDLGAVTLRRQIEEMVRLGCFMGAGGGASVWLENPASSWLFWLPEWRRLLRKWPQLGYWTVDYCRYGMAWRKRTRIATSTNLRGWKTLCTRDHSHLVLRGRSSSAKKKWTRIAQAYPRGVARAIATGLSVSCGVIEERDLDPAACARCSSRRIGEADHPGARRRKFGERTGLLSDVPLVEPKTLGIQSKTWEGFYNWLAGHLTPDAMESVFKLPNLLVLMLEEYGNYMYKEGHSLFMYRHLVVFVQQHFLEAKPLMSRPWGMVARWEKIEPTTHRVPLPLIVFKAMVGVSLGWGWTYFTAILVLGFCGIMRPSEPLNAKRRDLVLPSDRLEPGSETVFLQICKSKTSRRGLGRVQHASIQDGRYAALLEVIYRNHDVEAKLNPISHSAFRRRWDAVVSALGIPLSVGLTPGSVRGGGSVAAFRKDGDISKLMWRMRIKHVETLQNYLQEVIACTLVGTLSKETRVKIERSAEFGDFLVDRCFSAIATST